MQYLGKLVSAAMAMALIVPQPAWARSAGRCPQGTERITLAPQPLPSAAATRFDADLRKAVSTRDLQQFLGLLSDEVTVSFGGESGKAAFARQWQLDTPAGRELLWRYLDQMLELGGWNMAGQPSAGIAERFTYPWFFSAWPDEADPFDAFVAAIDTELRSRPGTSAPVVTRVSRFAVLRGRSAGDSRKDGSAGQDWIAVSAPCGERGYVREESVLPVLGTRLIAARRPEGWRIEAVVAGD
jgi:hypothetical protein